MAGLISEMIEKYYQERLDKRPRKAEGAGVFRETLSYQEGLELMAAASQGLN